MKVIPVWEAEGTVLCHDITEIIPGKVKSREFKKGHIVKKEDIPRLLKLGKEHLYVWEVNHKVLHETDAAMRIAKAVAGAGLVLTEPVEGKVELKAEIAGLLKINIRALEEINEIEEVVLASIHSNQLVSVGKVVAGCRVVPLVIDVDKICDVEKIGHLDFPIVEIKPLSSLKVGIVTTGSEVYHGRIKDQFGPVLQKKISQLGSTVLRQIIVDDNIDMIKDGIETLIQEGAEMIVTTGGMSVDPDDVTPAGIRAAGGEVVVYGAPVLPGSMFMLAYIGKIPVLGLPGCVMYHKTTIFDLVVPRILAGEKISRKDITRLAHGGLCTNCDPCQYPHCGFGKGN
ncbi:molybdopterin-binding protein [Pelosinus sp. sgz500959]|uniref:molybdopterin-binding protein n=1 Tax=Pelosinus sp. sgz500959 TaxID=3242472 RepID=UPI00366E1CAF